MKSCNLSNTDGTEDSFGVQTYGSDIDDATDDAAEIVQKKTRLEVTRRNLASKLFYKNINHTTKHWEQT